MDTTSANASKNLESTLHETINNVADKELDVIVNLSEKAHKTVESLAFRAAQLEDSFKTFVEKSKSYIQEKPFQSIGIALVASYLLAKLVNSRRDD